MTLKALADSLGLTPRRVVEIATGLPQNTYMREFIDAGVPTLLVEPQCDLYHAIVSAFGHLPHVTALQKLITQDGLHRRMIRPQTTGDALQASYVEGVYSPIAHSAMRTDLLAVSEEWCRGADCCTTAMIDDNDWDVLNLDAEGSEWLVLSTMNSRPRIIHVEVYGAYGYVNPDLHKIETWAAFNGYREIANPGLKDAGQNKVYIHDV